MMEKSRKNGRLTLRLPWPKGMMLLCSAGYGPFGGSPYHDDEHNAFYALDFDKPWRGNIMPNVSILAAADGEVAMIGDNPKHILGYHILLSHGNGYQTLYAHLRDKPNAPGLIQQGQAIGYLGETGHAQGPHLHFQLLYHKFCKQNVPQSRLEPMSGYWQFRVGRWYCSNNSLREGGGP